MIKFSETIAPVSRSLESRVLNLFPRNYDTLVLSARQEINNGVCCTARLAIHSKEEALNWFKRFQEKTITSYSVDGTFLENSQKLVFKKRYLCHYKTRASSSSTKVPHPKHRSCNAKLCITIKQPKMKRSKDVYLKKYPCEVDIRFTHNHPINHDNIRKRKRSSLEVENIFFEYFSRGHSPFSALESYKIGFAQESDYYKAITKCPNKKWCSELYNKIFQIEYDVPSKEETLMLLQSAVEEYNELQNDICAVLLEDPHNLILAICTPLMKRVYKLESFCEIIFVNSTTQNTDIHSFRVFLFLCPCSGGALPIGVIIAPSESENVISKGLEMLSSINGGEKFDPKIIMTDDSFTDRNIFKKVFPQASILLYRFCILQSIWRYVWDTKHEIDVYDRQHLYQCFLKIMDSQTEDIFNLNFEEFLASDFADKYNSFTQYMLLCRERSSEWALYARKSVIAANQSTLNYSEACIHELKTIVLSRINTFSVLQLFDFVCSIFCEYIKRKLVVIATKNLDGINKVNNFIGCKNIKDLACTIISNNEYMVTSTANTYYVNFKLQSCTCLLDSLGGPCVHQYAIIKNFNLVPEKHLPLIDDSTKRMLYFISTGQLQSEKIWFSTLDENNSDESSNLQNCEQKEGITDICKKEPDESESSDSELENRLDKVFIYLKDKFNETPTKFQIPLEHFVETIETFKTDSDLTAALSTFGKYNVDNKSIEMSESSPKLKNSCQTSNRFPGTIHRKTPKGLKQCFSEFMILG